MVRCYAVFNVEQADGLKLERQAPTTATAEPEWKAHQTAERVIKESGVHVRARARRPGLLQHADGSSVTLARA